MKYLRAKKFTKFYITSCAKDYMAKICASNTPRVGHYSLVICCCQAKQYHQQQQEKEPEVLLSGQLLTAVPSVIHT